MPKGSRGGSKKSGGGIEKQVRNWKREHNGAMPSFVGGGADVQAKAMQAINKLYTSQESELNSLGYTVEDDGGSFRLKKGATGTGSVISYDFLLKDKSEKEKQEIKNGVKKFFIANRLKNMVNAR